MMKSALKIVSIVLSFILLSNLASAVVVNSVEVSPMSPGQEGTIRIEIENTFNDKVEDVSLSLDFKDLLFIPIGTSEQSIDEIDENEEEIFAFAIRAANDITPGQYEIPYTIFYTLNNEEKSRTGTLGVKVEAQPDLTFTIETTTPVVGSSGRISLKIINKGFFDARFVSVRVLPEDFTLLSENEVYIGEIASDDFDTANFNVVFKNTDAVFNAVVEYKDFDNNLIIKNVEIPLQVYTNEEAVSLGIITPSRTVIYIIVVVVIIILIILWRWLRKKQRLKRSMKNNREEK